MLRPSEIALIFDFDNTLIMSNIDFLGVRHRLIDLLLEAGDVAQPRDALLPLALADIIGRAATPSLADRMWEIVRSAERQGLAGATLAAGTPEVLAALHGQGYRLGLLTNNAREMLAAPLQRFGMAPYFEVVSTRDDVTALKPAPDGIRHILARLAPTRRAFMIGDAWIDAEAAHRAGIRFVGIGPHRAGIEARELPIWAWVEDLKGILALDLVSETG